MYIYTLICSNCDRRLLLLKIISFVVFLLSVNIIELLSISFGCIWAPCMLLRLMSVACSLISIRSLRSVDTDHIFSKHPCSSSGVMRSMSLIYVYIYTVYTYCLSVRDTAWKEVFTTFVDNYCFTGVVSAACLVKPYYCLRL